MKAAPSGAAFSLYDMNRTGFLVFLAIAPMAEAPAQMGEEAAVRSSHPRGIASDGRPPQPAAARSAMLPANTDIRQGAAHGTTSVHTAPSATQASRQGVNISGSTRIDARSIDATATATGQENAAGNRVGVIGGKQD